MVAEQVVPVRVNALASDRCDVECDVMARALTLPDHDHEQFTHPPLKVMLGQVRFPAILRVASLVGLAEFQEELRGEYPTFAQEQQLNIAIGPEGVSSGAETKNFRFSTADGAWSTVLNPSFLTLEAAVATKYSNYDEFRVRFGRIWDVALRCLQPASATQQGLRYVDHLDWPDVAASEWGRFINSKLLGVLDAEELGVQIQHTLTDTRFDLGQGVVLSFKYGLVQSGPDNALGFLMDTDCFTQVATEDIAVDDVLGRFDRFHDEIHVLFHWAATDEAKERFRRGNNG